MITQQTITPFSAKCRLFCFCECKGFEIECESVRLLEFVCLFLKKVSFLREEKCMNLCRIVTLTN